MLTVTVFNPWWEWLSGAGVLLPAGMKWRLAAFPPDPANYDAKNKNKKKSPHQRRRHLNADHRAAATAPLGVRETVSFNAVVFPCMCPTKRDWMYNIWCTVPLVCLPPTLPPPAVLPHTSVRVYPPGLGECLKSYIDNHNVVCLLLCRPTDTASQLRPLPAATKTSSADLFVDAEPAGGGKKRSFGTRG